MKVLESHTLFELSKIEINLMAEAAAVRLGLDCEAISKRSFDSGADFFEIWNDQQQLTSGAREVLNAVFIALDFAPAANHAFVTAEQDFEILDEDDFNDYVLVDFEIESELEVYFNRKKSDIKNFAMLLEPHLDDIKKIKSYGDLLSLDKSILRNLINFEECSVQLMEAQNEAIDFQSGGHHQDPLDIYRSALNGEELDEDSFIFMGEGGKLHFSPYDDVIKHLCN